MCIQFLFHIGMSEPECNGSSLDSCLTKLAHELSVIDITILRPSYQTDELMFSYNFPAVVKKNIITMGGMPLIIL